MEKTNPAAQQLLTQMQTGCNKPICFNKYCKNNVMGNFISNSLTPFMSIAVQSDTRSEKELSDFVQFLVRKTSDPSELICAEAVMHDEKT